MKEMYFLRTLVAFVILSACFVSFGYFGLIALAGPGDHFEQAVEALNAQRLQMTTVTLEPSASGGAAVKNNTRASDPL
jgi:hypothetical protein